MSSITILTDIILEWDGSNFIVDSTPYSIPITITNAISSNVTVTLNFFGTIGSTSCYITTNSSKITFDGSNIPLYVSVASYGGLIQNNSNNDIIVQNIIINATSGTLASGAGWICRSNFVNGIINNCSSTGNMSSGCGGILGSNCNSCTAIICYSNGSINNGGGIFGSSCINCTANNCFSTGNILGGGGGIFGKKCNDSATSASCVAHGCYSTGPIGKSGNYNNGGIYGTQCNFDATSSTCTATNCFSTGNIYGDNDGANGGIFGTSAVTCIATNCYSIGNIGIGCGGIYCSSSANSAATYCYAFGNIGSSAGAIYGLNANSCTATKCYSVRNIGSSAGGIFGSSAVVCAAEASYSLGTLGSQAGSIFGSSVSSSFCSNCYALNGLSSSFFGSSGTSNSVSNNITENGGSWTDTNAMVTVNHDGSGWYSAYSNTPFLLTSFNTFGNLVPFGFQYFYIIPTITTITTNGTTLQTFLNGFYIQQQEDATVVTSTSIYGYTLTNYSIVVDVFGAPGSCFLEGTLILTSNGYVPIEKLCIGDLVKTAGDDYKNICLIGHITINNNIKDPNCIYMYNKKNISDLIVDLYITGSHSLLVDELPYNHYKMRMIGQKKYKWSTAQKLGNYYKLRANVDNRATKWNYYGAITTWHIAFDESAHGIYANGILVESGSISQLISSNMILIE
jgi:hypothetical protein